MAKIIENLPAKEIKKIVHAQEIAREYLKIAINLLEVAREEYSGQLSPNSQIILKTLQKHFGKNNQYVLKSTLKTIRKIANVLGDDGNKYRIKATNIGNKMGRAMFLGRTIKLGTPFFETNLRNRVVTIIHETGHIVGLNFLVPELYEGKSKNMPVIYRLYNADDVALFAYEIGQSREFKQV